MKSPAQRLQEHLDFTERAIDIARSSNLPDLTPLDGIDALCREIERSGGEVAAQADPILARLITQLDVLAEEITYYINQVQNKD